VAVVRVGDILVNEDLNGQGLAWVFTRCSDKTIRQKCKQLEAEARDANRVLWSMPNALPRWEFRRRGGNWVDSRKNPHRLGPVTDGG